jgi:hypothetical protein
MHHANPRYADQHYAKAGNWWPSEDSNRLSPGGLGSPRLYIQSGALQDIAFHLPAGRRRARAHSPALEVVTRIWRVGSEVHAYTQVRTKGARDG